MISRLKTLLLITVIGAVLVLPSLGQPPDARADGERLVLAFYYAWYDQNTWTSGQVPDVPLTPYTSANRDAMVRQVDQAQGAGIDAFVLNWWGTGNQTEKNLRTLLDVASEKGFRVAVDFDINSPFMGGVGSYADNLRHLHGVHATHAAYLRYQGRPVVFFYNVSRLPVATWRELRNQADPGRNALWIAEGTDLAYQSVFDGHHLYSITWPNRIPPSRTLPSWGNRVRKYNRNHDTGKLWVATVMPGYDDRKIRPVNGFARSRDGGEYYRQCWQAAIDSRPHWVIINSFNEWPEGSYIEPSRAYGNVYLDLTQAWSARFKSADYSVQANLSRPPKATATPLAPLSTPLPPVLPEGEWTSSRSAQEQKCIHAQIDVGGVLLWVVFCPSDAEPAGSPALIY
ncbi:MAG: hypothetical protein GWN58_66565 [Anaerolineae bacterium]|nr:hypothetical protein [Anaerolineae bacterium]